jgi:ABC-type nitrate/sulfonate/bicarbonate transport system substrate-binding protein
MLRHIVVVFFTLIVTSAVLAAEDQKLDRIRMGYSSISSSRITLWVTNDAGFFRKHGLVAEVVVTPGVQGTQALIAGELQFYLGGVDSAALAASRGADLIALATAEPIEYKLITQPGIKTVKDLKGKKVIVDRSGEPAITSLSNCLKRLDSNLQTSNSSRSVVAEVSVSPRSNLGSPPVLSQL